MIITIISFQVYSVAFSFSNYYESLLDLPSESTKEATQKAFGTQFYENLGQLDDERILYYSKIPGGLIGFGESLVMSWLEGAADPIIMSFNGAYSVCPKGVDQLGYPTNYFLGDKGSFTGIRSYEKITYDNLWDGIDLIYKMSDAGCKYEFYVEPGACIEDIVVQYSDFDSLQIRCDSMVVTKGSGELIDDGLMVYQDSVEISASFQPITMDTFGYLIGSYDKTLPLVIDPLVYSTYVGGSHDDWGLSNDIDLSGNVYVTGRTQSGNFPTLNAYDDTQNDQSDCYVLKISPTGDLIYATYIGGSFHDWGLSIKVDTAGNAYVAGQTSSGNFPVVNQYDTQSGNTDCFVLKLNSAGDDLLYSTYVGGTENDVANAITIDDSGNAYVTGHTYSDDFPMVNTLYSTFGADKDGFVFGLSNSGSNLLFSTFLPGEYDDIGYSIDFHVDGEAEDLFITGVTSSSDFPIVNAYDDSYNGGDGSIGDGFVLRMNSSGSEIFYSTYIGGSDGDIAWSVDVDSSGNAYVAGYTKSYEGELFPLVNSYDDALAGIDDAFVLKLNSSGNGLEFSTYYGGAGTEYAADIVLDSQNRPCIVGLTSSSDLLTTSKTFDEDYNLNEDGFIARFSADGANLNYSTYIGGDNFDTLYSIAIGEYSDVAYVAGFTLSNNIPRYNSYQPVHGGGEEDCFIFALDMDGEDTSPPDITVEIDPPNPSAYTTVTYRALVTDESPIEEVILEYSSDGGDSWTNSTMNMVGGYWTASLSTDNAEQHWQYKVHARDVVGYWSTTSTLSFVVSGGTGPNIQDIQRQPEYPDYNTNVVVAATVTDISGVEEVTLSYSNDDQSTWSNVTMVADIVQFPNTYRGTIPASSGRIHFMIYARDNLGFWSETTVDYYDVQPADEDPPSISNVYHSPDNPFPGDPVDIYAFVYDGGSGIDEVTLSYSINWEPWSNVSMEQYSGDSWHAQITIYDEDVNVIFKIFAKDNAGNWAETGDFNFNVERSNGGTSPPDWMFIIPGTIGPIVLCVICAVILRRRRKPKPVRYDEPAYYEAVPERVAPSIEVAAKVPEAPVPKKEVVALRGCSAVGGQFEYKVKVKNDTDSVITNVNVTIVAYPRDCMEVSGPTSKTISRVEPGGFRSPQFIFSPTKDCVEGKIQASVTYIDYQDNPHTIHVEPYIIRSVCDLLKPLETTMEEFDLMLFDMETTSDERTMQWNPQVLFSKAEKFLPARNFHVLDKKSDIKDGIFRGMIRGLAEGKYTGKKVALRIGVSGPSEGHESKVTVEGLGDDIAMLPTTIEEIEDGIDSWICLNCGGALDTEEVTQLMAKAPVGCRYCGHTLTIALYKK